MGEAELLGYVTSGDVEMQGCESTATGLSNRTIEPQVWGIPSEQDSGQV